jgi:Flp pilus assembly protein TadB
VRGWRDARCWREVLIRGGITAIMAGVIYFALVPEPLIWLAPVVVSALVVMRWVVRPETLDDLD